MYRGTAIPALQGAFLFGDWAVMDGRAWLLMTGLALLMACFGTGVAMAYQLAPAAIVGAFDYAYVAFAVLWGYLLLGDVPDALSVLGITLIAGGGVLVAGSRLVHLLPRQRAGSALPTGEAHSRGCPPSAPPFPHPSP